MLGWITCSMSAWSPAIIPNANTEALPVPSCCISLACLLVTPPTRYRSDSGQLHLQQHLELVEHGNGRTRAISPGRLQQACIRQSRGRRRGQPGAAGGSGLWGVVGRRQRQVRLFLTANQMACGAIQVPERAALKPHPCSSDMIGRRFGGTPYETQLRKIGAELPADNSIQNDDRPNVHR